MSSEKVTNENECDEQVTVAANHATDEMETIDFRCQVRFLHRQRLVPPFQVNQCATQFLASLKKECAGSSGADCGTNRCVVRLSERRGLRIVSHKRDEGFSESDSEQSDTYGQSHLAAESEHDRGSSGVNSSSSDIEEADWSATHRPAQSPSVRIECRLADILSCQNPAALQRCVLFTLRSADTLDIVAVECGTGETARILTHLCQNICLSANKNDTLKRPGPTTGDKKTPVVSIQPWSQRVAHDRNSDDEWSQWERHNTQTPPGGKTLDMARRLERQTSWNLIQRTDPSGVTHLAVNPKEANAAPTAAKTASSEAPPGDKAKGSHRSVRSYLSAQSSPSPSASSASSCDAAKSDKSRQGLKSRADSCIVSLQTPELPLPGTVAPPSSASGAAAAPARRESQRQVNAKKDKLVKSQSSPPVAPSACEESSDSSAPSGKKPSKLNNGWLNAELEAVLQAQLAERDKEQNSRGRQRERQREWSGYETHKSRNRLRSPTPAQVNPPAPPVTAAPTPAPSGSTKIKRDKSKTRSFLFKLTSSGDKSEKNQPENEEGATKKERGRSLLRRSAAMMRAPSQPPPASGQTYLIPTKSGELSRTLYPKDLNYGSAAMAAQMQPQQPHPIFVSGAYPVRLAYPSAAAPAFRSMQMAPVYWTELLNCQDANNNSNNHNNHNNHNNGPGASSASQLIYYQPVADLKRIRSRSQSPGRRSLFYF